MRSTLTKVAEFLGFGDKPSEAAAPLKAATARVTQTPVKSEPRVWKPQPVRSLAANVWLAEPRNAGADARDIVSALRAGYMVLINYKYLDVQTARQLIDFVGGAVYGNNGICRKIGANVILCATVNLNLEDGSQSAEDLLNAAPETPAEQPAPEAGQYLAATGTYTAQPYAAQPAYQNAPEYAAAAY
ncbi:MAG: cell division protein SepF [Candidatus Margulisbacteria bacterium]|jgi:FtsZ-interacting cell division protein YlmF|nr:cell division protein SepF [Candidatus Margulisiibacteriota bacterium]